MNFSKIIITAGFILFLLSFVGFSIMVTVTNETYTFLAWFLWALISFLVMGFGEALEYLKNLNDIMKKIDKRLGK